MHSKDMWNEVPLPLHTKEQFRGSSSSNNIKAISFGKARFRLPSSDLWQIFESLYSIKPSGLYTLNSASKLKSELIPVLPT